MYNYLFQNLKLVFIHTEKRMSELGEHDDLVVQGDVGETIHAKEEEQRISTRTASSGTVAAPKKSKIRKKTKSTKNQKDTTTASITGRLDKQTAAINKIGQMLQSLLKDVKLVERQSELIKQVQSQIKQLEKQISQVGKSIQKK
jgi:membrane-associated HD superfamily phosphohydrolase